MTRLSKVLIIVIVVVDLFGLGLLIQNIFVKGPVTFDIFCGLALGATIPAIRYIVRADKEYR